MTGETLTSAPPLRRRTRRRPSRRESPAARREQDVTLEEATRPRERPPPTATSAVDAMYALRLGTDGETFPTWVASEARRDVADGGDKRGRAGIALWAQTDPGFGAHFSLSAH
jgi:hypothetical protein